MKLASLLLVIIIFVLSVSAGGEEKYGKSKVKVPPGMALKKIGDVNLLYPKDAKVDSSKDGFVYVEEEDQYSAKKFLKINNRLNELRQKQKAIEAETDLLKKRIERLEGMLAAVEEAPVEEATEGEEEVIEDSITDEYE